MVKLKTGEIFHINVKNNNYQIFVKMIYAQRQNYLFKNMPDIPNGFSVQIMHRCLDWLRSSDRIGIFLTSLKLICDNTCYKLQLWIFFFKIKYC